MLYSVSMKPHRHVKIRLKISLDREFFPVNFGGSIYFDSHYRQRETHTDRQTNHTTPSVATSVVTALKFWFAVSFSRFCRKNL